MDYDDNDFQSQNFHLVGEDNKLPLSLRSFALPKFDIDEHLQGHLRFDSLVETEVLLEGIRSQGNNWIEDFSPGNSTIEFSSSAAESCSITRHNNVWSEATSSESVEMLLKSVGEDEMVNKTAITKEANAHDSVNETGDQMDPDEMVNKTAITKEADAHASVNGTGDQMDPLVGQEDSHNPPMMSITQTGPPLPPEKCHNNLSVSGEDVVRGQPHVEGTSQTSRDKKSKVDLDVSSLCEQIHTDGRIGGEQCSADEKLISSSNDATNECSAVDEFFETVQNEEPLDDGLMRKSAPADYACPPSVGTEAGSNSITYESVHNDPSAASNENLGMDTGKLNNESLSEQIVEEHKGVGTSLKLEGLEVDELQEAKSRTCVGGKVSDKLTEGHALPGDLCHVKDSSFSEPSMDSVMSLNEERNEPVFSKNSDGLLEAIAYQVKVLNKDSQKGDKSATNSEEMPSLAVEGDGNIEMDPTEVRNDDIAKLSHVTERFKDAGHSELEYLSKSDDLHMSTLSGRTEKVDIDEDKRELATFTEAIEGKQDPEGQSLDTTDTDVRCNSEVVVKVHALGNTECETQNPEIKDDADMIMDSSNFDSQKSETSIAETSIGHDNVKENTEKPNATSNPSKDTSLADDQVKILSSFYDKSVEMRDTDALAAEPKDCITSAGLSVSVIGEESRAPPTDSCSTSLSYGTDTVVEKTILDNPEGEDLASLNKSTSIEGTHATDTVLEQSKVAMTETASHTESLSVPLPPSTGKPSPDVCQKRQENNDEMSLVKGGGSVSQDHNAETECGAPACFRDNPPQCPLSRSNTESHLLEPGSGDPGPEPSCGSPTFISCNEQSQHGELQEGNRGLSDHVTHAHDNLPRDFSETAGVADKVKSTVHVSRESTACEDDKSFTFEVASLADLSERDTGNGWKPFSNMQSSPQISKDTSGVCPKESEESLHNTNTEVTGENKIKKVSGHGTENLSASKGGAKEKSLRKQTKEREAKETPSSKQMKEKDAKETPSSKQTKERDKNPFSSSCKHDRTASSNMQLEQMQNYSYVESSCVKVSCSPTIPTSNLPDLNTSISTAALSHQPFTDIQQVQLRAQIFVYGSLIQGIPPDEACMISAFGGTDGGKSLWDGPWRAAAESFQNQKSPLCNSETPMHLRSGVWATEPATRSSPLLSKALNSPASRISSKAMPSATVNCTVSLSSPLWSISSRDSLPSNMPRGTQLDFSQAVSPLHSYQSSQMRQHTTSTTPWFSQSSHTGSWVISSQSTALDASAQYSGMVMGGAQYSAIPASETVHVTPVRESAAPHASSAQFVPPPTLLPTQVPSSVSTASVVQIEAQTKTSASANSKNASSTQKSRRRRKGLAAEELGPAFTVSQIQTEPPAAAVAAKQITSAGFPILANSPSKVATSGLVSAIPPTTSSTHYQILASGNAEPRTIFSEETCGRIEQSKLQAEDAAAHAAAAVRHSQGIWSQLANQKKSGLVSEVEEKLASAAVAAAAAASVAKAAAEAAKVASEAALQAKMMADEALSSVKTGNVTQSSETGLVDVGENWARLTPVSILKGKDMIHGSTSVISAARAAARRRVEAASVATKQAENLDAILKAAELAAEAVSQAGTIIAMGDPLPFTLSELVEAGPEGYWKVHHATNEKQGKTNVLHGGNKDFGTANDHDRSVKQSNERPSSEKDDERISSLNGRSLQSEENYIGSDPTIGLEIDLSASNLIGNSIQKGSLVEVVADEDGLRGVWFSARVLDVRDGKAFVCYNDLLPDEGSGQLKEWIPLESDGHRAPRIRVAHPMSAAKLEGTRKRRRGTVENYAWEVGDRVDAWIRDGWWEGIVTEKNQVDETKLTVHFPAGGDTSIVRAWHLRPSLIWKDGQWIEWSRVRERNTLESFAGDTPNEKRQKLSVVEAKINSETDVGGVVNVPKNMHIGNLRKPEESRPLNLTTKEKIFSVGKNIQAENSTDGLKAKRTGLQKEGSRVVFGVPRPGKKRKFMEVSKHYHAEKAEKVAEGNDSIKFAKYLMPQASRMWRNTSKVDTKGKRAGDSKPRGLKSVRSQNAQSRGISDTVSASNGGESGFGSFPNARTPLSNDENIVEKKNSLDSSFRNSAVATDSLIVESSAQLVPNIPSSKKKSSATVEAEVGAKGKLTPAVDKPAKTEVKGSEHPGKTFPDSIGPRRSNRRIQPTSRLLEGLQSSLLISKIPSVSHDKGSKVPPRGASTSKGNTHG